MQISVALHLIGVVFWVGALLILTRFARLYAADAATPSADLTSTLKKSWFLYAIHGLALTLATGLYQLFLGGVGVYFKQGWFHTKLTFVIVMLVATLMLGLQLSKAFRGERVNASVLRLVQILSAVSFLVIVFLMKVGRV